MNGESTFVTAYMVALLGVCGLLEFYARQSTSAWSSRIFAGHRRAVTEAPEPADRSDWPHSEAHRFHQAVSGFVALIAIVLGGVELARHHRPLEAAVLTCAVLPHLALSALLVRRLRTAPHTPVED